MDASAHVPQAFVALYDYIVGPDSMPIPDSLLDELDVITEKLLDYGIDLGVRLPNLRIVPNHPRRPVKIDAADTIHRLRLIIPECLEHGIDLQDMLNVLLAMAADNARPNREALCGSMRTSLAKAEQKRRSAADVAVTDGEIEDLITKLLEGT